MQTAIRAASLGEDLRQVAPLAQRCGYRGVQLDMRLGDLDLSGLSGSGKREVRHLLAVHELELASLRVQFAPESFFAAGDDRLLWTLGKAIDAAAGLTAKMICVDLGRLPSAGEPQAPKRPISQESAGLIIIPGQEEIASQPQQAEEPADPQAWARVDGVMHEAGVRADAAGVVLAFSSELSSFAALKRAVEHAACPWFGVDLDAVSILRDRWNAEQVLDAVGAMVRHVRLRDALKGSGGRTQPAALGKGSTNWQELLALLDEGGYGGWMVVDSIDLPNRAGEAVRALSWLKAL